MSFDTWSADIQGCASLLMSTLFSLGGLPAHPQKPSFLEDQLVRSKHKQNWINHLERMDNTRHPKHALNYIPRGRRDRGRPKKRWQHVDAGKGQTT
jgi:hypothetical protein